jgi:hypothetical protein
MPKPTAAHLRSGEPLPDLPPRTDPTPKTRLCQQALAERWGISTKTLERWRVVGIGPVYIRLPGKVIYRLEDVEDFEQRSLRQGTDQAYCAGGDS